MSNSWSHVFYLDTGLDKGWLQGVRLALADLYRWYRETERMMTVAARDLAQVPVLAEVLEPQRAWLSEAHAILTDGWPAPFADTLRAVVGHALAFATWRSLARDFGLPDQTVADLMTALVVSAARRDVPAPANEAIVAT